MDDEWDIQNTLEMVFSLEGYSVRVAYNGEEALERLKESPLPEVILCDLMMPKFEGYGFVRALKNNPKFAKIPVILSSAGLIDPTRIAKEHYEFLLPKRYDLTTLISTFDKALNV